MRNAVNVLKAHDNEFNIEWTVSDSLVHIHEMNQRRAMSLSCASELKEKMLEELECVGYADDQIRIDRG
jgi:hypothetical protein